MATIFDDIVAGKMHAWTVWEDDNFMAFLTPFPNTPGFTVVIPKKNYGDNAFLMDDEVYSEFLQAVKTVANVLKNALEVPRVALVIEGTGVPYVHAKLIPLHGDVARGLGSATTKEQVFHEEYQGWLTTLDGPKMSDDRLREIQEKIIKYIER